MCLRHKKQRKEKLKWQKKKEMQKNRHRAGSVKITEY